MVAQLIAEKGLVKGLALSFEEGETWAIGRDPEDCQLVIEDPKVSRKHLICRKIEEGIILENLSETNHVLVNQMSIEGPYLLQEGDLIKIGDNIFRFFSSSKEETAPPSENQEEKLSSEENFEDDENLEDESLFDDENEYYETIYTRKEISFGASIYTGPPTPPPAEDTQQEETSQDLPEIPQDSSPKKKEADKETPQIKQTTSSPESTPVLPESRWLLKVMTGPSIGQEYPLHEGQSYVIGSEKDSCDITLHDISVSRKHARIVLNPGEENLTVEDLQSRNGTLLDGSPIEEPSLLTHNQLVSLGTSSFLVIDKEGKTDTIVSLPFLQKEDEELSQEEALDKESKEDLTVPTFSKTKLAFISIIIGISLLISLGTISLLKTDEIIAIQAEQPEKIKSIVSDYPDVEFSYQDGSLFILGHVTTKMERDQLTHALEALPFIKEINNNIVIDEFVWQEMNQILSKNPAWRSISLQAPKPGQFNLTGYLQSTQESEALTDYINLNFAYLDRLNNQVVVEEQLIERVNVSLIENAFSDVFVEITSGELTVSGYMSSSKAPILQKILDEIKVTPGIRNIKNFVVELAPEDSMINLTNRYEITGHFRHANVSVSVVINGRILARGDTLDGMKITSIKPDSIFLEKDGFKFRIDYNK